MHLISTYSNTDETKKLYEIFQVLDTDGNGVLSKEEIIYGFKLLDNS